MALPSNDKIIGDLGHTEDHNAIVNEIIFIKENYLSASGGALDTYLTKDSASALYARISSPTFTGTPLAPTAASGTNTTQIATTAFVRSEVAALVDSAPSTLDTLNELAAALGDDPNFATTVTQSLSNKLDSAVASATYLTQTSAANLYFPKSASGGLLTESEAAELYLPISASSSLSPIGYLTEASASATYLSKNDAINTYLPISASSSFSPIGYLTASAAANIYAPLNSPALTGLPTAPTASVGSNSSQIATTEFVYTAVLAAQSGSIDLSAYLTKSAASATYLPISASATLSPIGYLTASAASDIYLSKDSASTIYLPISASANFTGGSGSVDLSAYLTSAVASATYLPISASSGLTLTAAAIMSPTEPENPVNGAIWVDTDSEMLPYSSSAVDLSIYLTKASASAIYIAKDDFIDCGGP